MVGKGLDKHCPEVVLTIEQQKADYLLQAKDTGAGKARKPYKFTLFDATGDRVFSTETSGLDSAMKDVCGYIRKREISAKGATLPVPPGAVLCANGPSDPMPSGTFVAWLDLTRLGRKSLSKIRLPKLPSLEGDLKG